MHIYVCVQYVFMYIHSYVMILWNDSRLPGSLPENVLCIGVPHGPTLRRSSLSPRRLHHSNCSMSQHHIFRSHQQKHHLSMSHPTGLDKGMDVPLPAHRFSNNYCVYNLSIYLSLSISISIYLYLSLSISIYLYLSLSISISIYLYLSLSISIYLYLPTYLSIHPAISIYLSSYLSSYLYLAIYLAIYLSTYLSIYLSHLSLCVCYVHSIFHLSQSGLLMIWSKYLHLDMI